MSTESQGQLLAQPDTAIGSDFFLGEPHFQGLASELHWKRLFWGRRVDVADISGRIRLRNFVIGDGVRDQSAFQASDGSTLVFALKPNGLSAGLVLTIPTEGGNELFHEALEFLESNLTPVFAKSTAADETGPFSMIPRNATLVLVFDDLLQARFEDGLWRDGSDGDLVDPETGQLARDLVDVRVGYPPVQNFDALILADPNHGAIADPDLDGELHFYSTRLLIQPTIDESAAQNSQPPLAVNTLGLPASVVLDSANVALRIATNTNPAVGQTRILRNASNHALGIGGNGPTDGSTGTVDVVRAMRSGGRLTLDANNGFLLDEDPPSILGDFEIVIDGIQAPFAPDPQHPERVMIPLFAYPQLECLADAKVGDLIEQGGLRAVVTETGTRNGGQVRDMLVEVLSPLGGQVQVGSARHLTPFDGDSIDARCYLSFSPAPGLAPASQVSKDSAVVLRFSEAMDPDSVRPFDTFSIRRVAGDPLPTDYVVGEVVASADLRSFRFAHPRVPFRHLVGNAETYYIDVRAGDGGPTDLAGNPVQFGLPQVPFELDATEPSSINAGFAMRFDSADEFFDDGLFELRNGQLLYDPVNERVLPRPVNRFDVAADRNQPLPSVMTQFVGGIQTPLSRLGSKLQTLWRYVDVGFALTDETNINVDVEGISWAPVEPSVQTDVYEDFGMILAHTRWLPDEYLIPPGGPGTVGTPMWPASGLKVNFDNNYLDLENDPGTWVHPKERGYVVAADDLYTAVSGTTMIPYPMNRGVEPDQRRYYTWRDTALTALGGGSGNGAILDQENQIVFGNTITEKVYAAGAVPTVGLPLMLEVRCFPSDQALGLNAIDISLASNSSIRPNFRAFSTGGFVGGVTPEEVNPDTSATATGGYNPSSTPPGNQTPGTDNSFYVGELALLTRVSRVHTIWFDTGFPRANFEVPTIEPKQQAEGTELILAFRGASSITNQGPNDILHDSTTLDFYGDSQTDSQPALTNGGAWVDDISLLTNARFFQARLSFVSNAATGQTPELQSLGFAYFDATATN